MIVERILEAKEKKIVQYPVNANRASNLGYPCTRYLVFERTRWQEKTLHGADLQMIFDLGNDMEVRVLKDLDEAGFQVIEQQRAFKWKEYNITGHIDAKVVVDGTVYPIEIKSMSPFAFDKTNSVQDMLKSKYPYMRQYPGQMTLYLLMDNKDKGYFLLKNKATGRMKEVLVEIDYELGESLLKKAEVINNHVANDTLPEPPEWDDMMCSECGYLHICRSPREGNEVQIVDSAELLDLLNQWNELKPVAKEFKEIDEQLSKALNGHDKLLVGDYFITGSWRETTRYNVPDEVKEQYKTTSRYWVKKIQRV